MRRLLAFVLALGATVILCVARPTAQDTLRWPVKADLVAKDWTLTDAQPWVKVGNVRLWNTFDGLTIEILPGNDSNGRPFKIKEISVATANATVDLDAYRDSLGKPAPSLFPYKTDYLADQGAPADRAQQLIPKSVFSLCWGTPDKCPLDRYVLVHVELMMLGDTGYVPVPEPAFAGIAPTASTATLSLVTPFLDKKSKPIGWYVTYPFAKVETGHFVDAKVKGLTFWTATQSGTSSDSGNFFYIPPERVYFSIGSVPLGDAVADHTVTPMDLFPGSDLGDDRVLNVARLLQSMDANDTPGTIDLTPNIPCLESAVSSLGLTAIDFGDDGQVGAVLGAMQSACPALAIVSKDQAALNLNQGQQAGNILRTNISKNPAGASDKAKIEIMPFYVPARRADDTSTNVVYHDEAGNVIETRSVAKPIVVTYEEEIVGTGARDVIVAISRDDGSTWKRTNISKTAGKSSFTTETGTACAGESNKPMLNVKDNKIFVAWTDKYCKGGRPGYAIKNPLDYNCSVNNDGIINGIQHVTHDGIVSCVADYPGDDAFRQEDLYGVGGSQRSVTYTDEWADLGEVPYSCVWTARGKIDDAGNIIWFKPERITSGRRDANQLTAATADDVGLAIAWQEDPKGLRPPEEFGPGDGWSGATVSKKTDIWYSFLKWSDFDLVDTAYAPPDHDDHVDTDPELGSRAKTLVPFSMPVKITDNDRCSLEAILGLGGEDGEDHEVVAPGGGTHRYCGTVEGIGTAAEPGANPLCAYTVPLINHNGELHNVCVTAGDFATRRVLDGNSGASRPNLFLQPFTKKDGTKTAAAILAYEESKGVGLPPDEGDHDELTVLSEDDDDRYKPDLGKNVIYHSFEFDAPKTVDGGLILNTPETDDLGNIIYVRLEDGTLYTDPLGRNVPNYENARRVRLLQQSKGKASASISKTILVALWRQGAEGNGKAADIFMRRMTLTPDLGDQNPYSSDHFAGKVQNVSSVTPGEVRTYTAIDPGTNALTTFTKMVNWTWEPKNLGDKSATEPYSDAKAHRGALNGDELIIGYTWTPNWGRQSPDKYDLFVRRSWDGGQSWKNGNSPITHTNVFIDPETKVPTVTIRTFEPGEMEPPRNVSSLRNNRISVLEPRIVKTPGSILTNGGFLYPEDEEMKGIYQVAWGLEVNELMNSDGQPFRTPLDIYYGRTIDKGQNYETVLVTRSDGSGKPQEEWNLLAKDKPEQAGAQLKQTPDGSRMYAIWVENGAEGSDIIFRRIDYRKK